MYTIRALMSTPLVTVEPGTPIQVCADLLVHHDIGHLPVVQDGSLQGLVADFSVLDRGWMLGDRWVPHNASDQYLARHLQRMVHVVVHQDQMTTSVLRKLMRSFQDAAVVVDDNRHPVGIVTEHDIVRVAASTLEPDQVVSVRDDAGVACIRVDRPAGRARDLMRRTRTRHLIVVDAVGRVFGALSYRDVAVQALAEEALCRELVTRPVHSIQLGRPLREAARRMAAQNIGCLPIVDDDHRPVGIVTRTDVLRAIAALWAGPTGGLTAAAPVRAVTAG